MGENLNEVFSALGEKIRSLKTDIFLKDCEIKDLKAENAELQRRVEELERKENEQNGVF